MTHKTVLVADDDQNVRNILCAICEQVDYRVLQAATGKEAVRIAREELPDLVLMDGMMPDMDGFEATGVLKGDRATENIPVIIVTGLRSREDRIRGIGLGANDFVTKPFDREEILLRIRNNLKIKEYGDLLATQKANLGRYVMDRTQDLRQAIDEITEAQRETDRAYQEVVLRLTRASEFRDEDTGAHIQRIGHYCHELSQFLSLEPSFTKIISHASVMHDIGKIAIPDKILLKNGPLTTQEWEEMKTHAAEGARILSDSSSSYLQMGEEIALTHHERWDGSGYPSGLTGRDIPISGRITHLADVYDALRSRRPYKPELSHTEAVRIIREGDERIQPHHFWPDVLAVFLENHDSLDRIYQDQRDLPQDAIPVE